jgi:hypothetical protein
VFEPTSEMWAWGDEHVGLLRYQALIEFGGPAAPPPLGCWHTDCYELWDGRWQAVWSQATEIADQELRIDQPAVGS